MAFGDTNQLGFKNTEQLVANQVILTGPGESLLAYSPSEGPNNLVASIANGSFVDKFGNQVLDGVVGYGFLGGSNYTATAIGGGVVQFWSSSTGEAGPWTVGADISFSGLVWLFQLIGGSLIEFEGSTIFADAVEVGGVLTASDGINVSGNNLNLTGENFNL